MHFDAKAVRQSPIIVRLGTDSVNPFRQQIYRFLVNVALKPQTAKPAGSPVKSLLLHLRCITSGRQF
jgi:hypothetical protein